MSNSLLYQTSSLVIASILLVLMLVFYTAGHRLLKKKPGSSPSVSDGLGVIEGSLLGLLALLLSFTFNLANSKYDSRAAVMVQEANVIRTAGMRTDLFPDSMRRLLRAEFKEYVASRIALYDAGMDAKKNEEAYRQSLIIAGRIWQIVVSETQSPDNIARTRAMQMIPPLNEMINSISTRRTSREITIPSSILWLLFLLCLASSFIVGYGSRKKTDWVLVTGFALMVTVAVFSILDLDHPHNGLITLDNVEMNIVELKSLFE